MLLFKVFLLLSHKFLLFLSFLFLKHSVALLSLLFFSQLISELLLLFSFSLLEDFLLKDCLFLLFTFEFLLPYFFGLFFLSLFFLNLLSFSFLSLLLLPHFLLVLFANFLHFHFKLNCLFDLFLLYKKMCTCFCFIFYNCFISFYIRLDLLFPFNVDCIIVFDFYIHYISYVGIPNTFTFLLNYFSSYSF